MRWVVRVVVMVVLFAFTPTGGVHGQLLVDRPILTARAVDSQNLIFWDPVRNHYRCNFQDFREGRRDITMAALHGFRRFALRDADLHAFGFQMPPAIRG